MPLTYKDYYENTSLIVLIKCKSVLKCYLIHMCFLRLTLKMTSKLCKALCIFKKSYLKEVLRHSTENIPKRQFPSVLVKITVTFSNHLVVMLSIVHQ